MLRDSVLYYYACYRGIYGDMCHQFTTDKDSLPADALVVTSFRTEYPGKLWRVVETYAIQTGETCYIDNDHHCKEWVRGSLYYSDMF